jgi:hypothetical protein
LPINFLFCYCTGCNKTIMSLIFYW